MKLAWMLVKTHHFTKEEAMKQAWMVSKLRSALRTDSVSFAYRKINGDIRYACGTLKPDLLPQSPRRSNRKRNETVLAYFDQGRQSFRCFKIANLLDVA